MTTAVDTNVLIQFITHQDPSQAADAERLVRDGIEIGVTVLLETEWVLRAIHRMRPADVASRLRAILRIPTVSVRDAEAVKEALRLFDGGLDFADALHAATARAPVLRTFDREFVRRAKRARSRTKIEGA